MPLPPPVTEPVPEVVTEMPPTPCEPARMPLRVPLTVEFVNVMLFKPPAGFVTSVMTPSPLVPVTVELVTPTLTLVATPVVVAQMPLGPVMVDPVNPIDTPLADVYV